MITIKQVLEGLPHQVKIAMGGTLWVTGQRDLELDFNSAMLYDTVEREGNPNIRRDFLHLQDCQGVHIHNLVIKGFRADGKSNYRNSHQSNGGIFIGPGCQDICIDNVRVQDVGGDGIEITGKDVSGVSMSHIRSVRANRQGISINRGENIVLAGSLIRSPGRSGVDIEAYAKDWVIRNVQVRDCDIWDFPNYGLVASGAGQIDNVVVINVNLYGKYNSGAMLVDAARGYVAHSNNFSVGNGNVKGPQMDPDFRFGKNVQYHAIGFKQAIKVRE